VVLWQLAPPLPLVPLPRHLFRCRCRPSQADILFHHVSQRVSHAVLLGDYPV
jgi:hypothetical protein